MYKIRTIENLKLQIGEILARGEKELERNLKKLPWLYYTNKNNKNSYILILGMHSLILKFLRV